MSQAHTSRVDDRVLEPALYEVLLCLALPLQDVAARNAVEGVVGVGATLCKAVTMQ
jgi:hypothetical protein